MVHALFRKIPAGGPREQCPEFSELRSPPKASRMGGIGDSLCRRTPYRHESAT